MNYIKSNTRQIKIPSCKIGLEDVKKLYEILDELNQEALELELKKLRRNVEDHVIKITEEQISNREKRYKELYFVSIQISGAKGEFIASHENTILDKKHLPDIVNSIKLDNTVYFNSEDFLRQSNQIIVEFDFTKEDFIDFSANPSKETYNKSYLGVYGENETWVEGAYEKIISFVKQRKNRRGWLHRKNNYDFFLWLFNLPLIFRCLYKFDLYLKNQWPQISGVYKIFLELYFVIIGLYLFSIIFKYSRWLFPYVEFNDNIGSGGTLQRAILILIVTTIFAYGIQQLIGYLLSIIF